MKLNIHNLNISKRAQMIYNSFKKKQLSPIPMKQLIYFIVLIVVFSSCKKVIQLDLNNNTDVLVIDGAVTNVAGPYYVRLNKSVNFNAPSTYPPVTNAQVIISDNLGQRDTLTHTGNGLYRTNSLKGFEGRTYSLSVLAEGKTYTAQSTMPAVVKLDSLRLSVTVANDETNYSVVPVYTDPIVLGNSYRFIQTINGKLDETYFAFNDNLNNGVPNQRPLRSGDPELKLLLGDVVNIEMQCISVDSYTYYYSLSQQTRNGGGGTAPANPPNNITGGALGIFSALTSQKKTVVIK
jgi:hypothetical protein